MDCIINNYPDCAPHYDAGIVCLYKYIYLYILVRTLQHHEFFLLIKNGNTVKTRLDLVQAIAFVESTSRVMDKTDSNLQYKYIIYIYMVQF